MLRALCCALSPRCSPFSSEGQKFKVKVLAGFVSPTGCERRLRPRPLSPACRWLPLCFLFTRPFCCVREIPHVLTALPQPLTNAGVPPPGVSFKPLMPLATETDEQKWVKSAGWQGFPRCRKGLRSKTETLRDKDLYPLEVSRALL